MCIRLSKTSFYLFFQLTSVACLSSVLSSGLTANNNNSPATNSNNLASSSPDGLVFGLPYFPRLRAMMFICIFTILLTVFVLFLNISHLSSGLLQPAEYGRMVKEREER